jgi:radical SAM protein with 4Fe4S-binding SPASM domain
VTRPRLATLIFEVTRRCNHSCPHCYNFWAHPDYRADAPLPEGDLRPLLEQALSQVDCDLVTLTGGEPLLRADLPEIVSFLAECDKRVNLISNGHLLTEPVVADLIARGVGLFELPLLSHRREVHDSMSGCPGAFDAVLAALAHIRHHRGQAVAVFVATRHNVADIEDTLRLAYAFGARGVMVNRLNPGGRCAAAAETLLPSLAELRRALDAADGVCEKYGLPVSCSIPIQPCLIDLAEYPRLGHGYCAAGSERAYYTIDTAGDVRPCNHTPTVLGNVWRETLAEMMASPVLRHFTGCVPEHCRPCSRLAECQGGCRAAAQVCYGDLAGEEPLLRANRALSQPIVAAEGRDGEVGRQ